MNLYFYLLIVALKIHCTFNFFLTASNHLISPRNYFGCNGDSDIYFKNMTKLFLGLAVIDIFW